MQSGRGVGNISKLSTLPHLENGLGSCNDDDAVSTISSAITVTFPQTGVARERSQRTCGGRESRHIVGRLSDLTIRSRVGSSALMAAYQIEDSRCVPVKTSNPAPGKDRKSCTTMLLDHQLVALRHCFLSAEGDVRQDKF